VFCYWDKKQPVFPGCPLAHTLKEAPKTGLGRMHKLVWFSHGKDNKVSFDLWALIPYPGDHN
jgi:hypothetical protein